MLINQLGWAYVSQLEVPSMSGGLYSGPARTIRHCFIQKSGVFFIICLDGI